MQSVEEGHALGLVLSQMSKLGDGRKLKVGIDIDDTVADVSSVVKLVLEERHGFDFTLSGRKFDWSASGVRDKHFIDVYNELWAEDGLRIRPMLSAGSYKELVSKTDFTFVSARSDESTNGLYKWLERHYGKEVKVAIVEPRPYDMHGMRKLEQGYDILVDDSPHVAATMSHELAKNRALLLVDKWEEAIGRRHAPNTAVVENVEHAARIIFEAHRLSQKPIEKDSTGFLIV